ncbi:MAG: hypothetical protein IPO40_18605 [Fibrobacteres bacterium]|nr:hypothetical protein [Fibrobacterota bacterium]
MRLLSRILSCLVSAWFLASCSESAVAGGSGTEAGNGLKVAALGPDGTPVVGARIEVRAARSESAQPLVLDSTGADGVASLQVPEGAWAVLVRKGDLAFWTLSNGTGRITDTLRPTAQLSGIVEGGEGTKVSALGLGDTTRCDAEGYFQLENLPSGQIPLGFQAVGNLVTSSLDLEPGSRSIALAKADSIPRHIASLASDSLIPWSLRSAPATLPREALGDSGHFSVAVRLHRQSLATPVWAISWMASRNQGLRVGWRGADTFILGVDGRQDSVVGIPLDTGAQQLGLSWDGHRMIIRLGSDTVVTRTYSNFDRRTGWPAPLFGSEGVSRVDWVAFKRGKLMEEWLVRLSQM